MNHQRTKIVCTLGPASEDPRVLLRMIRSGVDVFRMNASHGTPAWHADRIARIRRLARSARQPIGILLDLPGPKLRLGQLVDEKQVLRKGETVLLVGPTVRRAGTLPVRDVKILEDLRPGHEIYLADGTVQLVAGIQRAGSVNCRVQVGGTVRSGSGLNLPDTHLSNAVPTLADRKWIRFACEHRVDWLAISFVQSARDVGRVRRLAGTGGPSPRLIAKIEKRGALRDLESIVTTADAVMVARGDLGVETPLPEVPMVQKRIIGLANAVGRPVITATQMLESMVDHPTPTRAEVADVANAILDGTDAVMLSAESAIGQFPIESVLTLGRVAISTEAHYPYGAVHRRFAERDWTHSRDAISFGAVRLATDCRATAILVDPNAETSASSISRFRPEARVVALCHSWEEACRQTLAWGVDPLVVPRSWKNALPILRQRLNRIYGVRRGSRVVLVQPALGLYGAGSDLLRILKIG